LNKVERLEVEIRNLSAEELATFREWFREFDSNAWDREIEADALAGELDALADRALRDHRAGKSTTL
jgi:hypothetical protein